MKVLVVAYTVVVAQYSVALVTIDDSANEEAADESYANGSVENVVVTVRKVDKILCVGTGTVFVSGLLCCANDEAARPIARTR